MFRILIYLLAIIGISSLHIAAASIIPFPYNSINVTVLALGFLVLTHKTNLAIAVALFMGIVIELYAVTPFGLLLSALMVSLFIGTTLATRAITTLTLPGSILLILIMVLAYRVSFFIFIGIQTVSSDATAMPLVQTIQSITAETVATTFSAALILGLSLLLTRQRRASVVQKKHHGILT